TLRGVRSEWLGQFWRVWGGKFWRAPKVSVPWFPLVSLVSPLGPMRNQPDGDLAGGIVAHDEVLLVEHWPGVAAGCAATAVSITRAAAALAACGLERPEAGVGPLLYGVVIEGHADAGLGSWNEVAVAQRYRVCQGREVLVQVVGPFQHQQVRYRRAHMSIGHGGERGSHAVRGHGHEVHLGQRRDLAAFQ